MMKLRFFLLGSLLLLPAIVFGEGPRFQHKDTAIQQEFEAVYQNVSKAITKSSTTATYVSKSSATANYFKMTGPYIVKGAAGEITRPLQPGFLAFKTSSAGNATGDGSNVTVSYDSEYFDVGGDFNTGTYQFTVPIDGYYKFGGEVEFGDVNTTHEYAVCTLVTSNKTYTHRIGLDSTKTPYPWIHVPTIRTWMDSGDTAYVAAMATNGDKTVDIVGDAAPNTCFWGALSD